MIGRTRRGGFLAMLLLAAPGSAAALSPTADTTRIGIGAGASFEAHLDRLASPYRQTGIGAGAELSIRRGGFSADFAVARAGTSSSIEAVGHELEDLWITAVETGWTHRVAGDDRSGVRVGGSVGGLGFVRHHTYGPFAAPEYYIDVIFPLSAVGEFERRWGSSGRIRERVSLGVLARLHRSSFAATKGFPEGALVGPGSLRLARNRLTLERAVSDRIRLVAEHALTFYDSGRTRPVRTLHQEFRVGLALLVGGGP